VEVGGSHPHALGLAAHFDQVVRIPERRAADPVEELAPHPTGGALLTAGGSGAALPLRDGSVDCVALRTPLAEGSDLSVADLLAEARRVLREGGCATFGFDNHWWTGALRARRSRTSGAGPAVTIGRVRRDARTAGFRALDVYYADPPFPTPATLIPCSRSAAASFEMHRITESRTRLVRRALALGGVHRVLHPSYLCIAYA
jgi:SAM-dependent methyltransferase